MVLFSIGEKSDIMSLSEEEVERYARHIVLKEIGGQGQAKLRAARVLVIGAGGLGSPCALYLAAAGVGTLGIVDDDVVSLSNLQRQILHHTEDVGRPKVQSAADNLNRLNPHVEVCLHQERLTEANAADILSRYDIVADGCDSFETRFVVDAACYRTQTPLVSAAVGQFEGQLAVFRAWERTAEGTPRASYRDLVPDLPPPGAIPTCEEAGVVGALTGVMGSLQAMETIKLIVGAGEPLVDRLLIYDALGARFRTLRLKHDPANPITGNAGAGLTAR